MSGLGRGDGERVLQAEGAPWVKRNQDKSRDSSSFAASETMQVLASAMDRGNCGQLTGGQQSWVTTPFQPQQEATWLVDAAEESLPSVFRNICS